MENKNITNYFDLKYFGFEYGQNVHFVTSTKQFGFKLFEYILEVSKNKRIEVYTLQKNLLTPKRLVLILKCLYSKILVTNIL